MVRGKSPPFAVPALPPLWLAKHFDRRTTLIPTLQKGAKTAVTFLSPPAGFMTRARLELRLPGSQLSVSASRLYRFATVNQKQTGPPQEGVVCHLHHAPSAHTCAARLLLLCNLPWHLAGANSRPFARTQDTNGVFVGRLHGLEMPAAVRPALNGTSAAVLRQAPVPNQREREPPTDSCQPLELLPLGRHRAQEQNGSPAEVPAAFTQTALRASRCLHLSALWKGDNWSAGLRGVGRVGGRATGKGCNSRAHRGNRECLMMTA